MSEQIPQHLQLALANAARAMDDGNFARLATVNEALQPLVDAAVKRARQAEGKAEQLAAEVLELRAEVKRLREERWTLDPERADDYTADALLRRVVETAGGRSPLRPARVHVRAMTGLGSTMANALCRRYGVDPDELRGIDDSGVLGEVSDG